jgi:cyclic pyranopterin phosphate synthase
VNFIESVARIKTLEDLSMTTNGLLLKTYAKALKEKGLHRVNVSLDTLRPDRFSLLTRGGNLQDVLDGIETAKQVGLGVKLNCVVNKGINEDEIDDFIQLTKTWGFDVRFIELMPIGDNLDYAKEHFYSNDQILLKHPELVPVKADDPSSPARYYQMDGAKGKVGLISPLSCKFCAQCNRLRLTPDGKLKPCLHSDLEIDLKTPLRNGEDILPYIQEALDVKPEKHLLDDHQTILRQMSRIGG